ncbi:MAG: hypothetical protein JO015_14320 [Verrucomicrobia bacterium]|nr:hypothetical protein [Verrucomicrobiota bacterium]
MPLLNRFAILLGPGAWLAFGLLLLSAGFPGGLQAQELLPPLKVNGPVEPKSPGRPRRNGLSESLKSFLRGPGQEPPGLRAEAIATPAVAITSVQLAQEGDGLRVRGGLRCRGFGAGYGHLDIQLLDQGRRVLSVRAVSYQPNPVPTSYRGFIGRSEFYAHFNRLPPGVAIVRVRFHPKD